MIKAIETVYNGYRFRSRLEARWAVFFDTLGVKYEYEKEGFDLDGVRYLPDFWLPELDCWVEIKGPEPTKEEQIKLATLTSKDDKWIGIIRSGTPDAVANEGYGYIWGKCIGFQAFIECLECGTIGMIIYNPPGIAAIKGEEFHGFEPGEPIVPPIFGWRLRCDCRKKYGKGEELSSVSTDTPRLIAAYTTARQARFEYGETPRPSKVDARSPIQISRLKEARRLIQEWSKPSPKNKGWLGVAPSYLCSEMNLDYDEAGAILKDLEEEGFIYDNGNGNHDTLPDGRTYATRYFMIRQKKTITPQTNKARKKQEKRTRKKAV